MKAIQAHFRRAGPRSDRRRAGNASPKPGRSIAPTRRSRASIEFEGRRIDNLAQGNDLRRHAGDPPPARQGRLVRQRLRGQRRRRASSTTGTTSASRSKRTTIPRPSSPTAAPTPASAASSAIRSAPGLAPSRSATPTSSASLRPTRRRSRLPPGVLHPQAADARRGRRRPRLRQPHGHSHRQRRRLFRRALSGQSAGLLRHGRPDPGGPLSQGTRRPAT